MYYGTFTTDHNRKLSVDMNRIEYKAVDGMEWEVNTVYCNHLSEETFLANNDTNITASCLRVNVYNDSLFTIHASPCFWAFLFQKQNERKIQPADTIRTTKYEVTHAIRIAYKAFQMQQFSYSLCGIDLARGTIAKSQKEKIDKMNAWHDSPFLEYRCKEDRSHFVLVKKHDKLICASQNCLGRANRTCTHKMCKKHCIEHVRCGNNKCKLKEHAVPQSEPAENTTASSDNTSEGDNADTSN